MIERMEEFCKQHGVTLVLDAQTEDCSLRMTSLENELTCVMRDFQEWVMENSLKAKDIWYADLFRAGEASSLEHVASLFVEPDGVTVSMESVPKNSKIAAFRRKPGIRRRFRHFMAQLGK